LTSFSDLVSVVDRLEFLRMIWAGDGWARASKVVRANKVLLREVSANFPRDEKGEVDWGEPGAQDKGKADGENGRQ
jgi:hypothetical protein